MRRKLLVPFPNLQPIEWAGARFTRALYLSFLKLDKTEPVPKEHFGDGSFREKCIDCCRKNKKRDTEA